MATNPIAIARLLTDVKASFITAINMDMEIREGYNYSEDVQKAVGADITAIGEHLDSLINAVIAIVPKKEEPAEAPAEAEQPAEQSVEAPAEPVADESAEQ